MQITPTALAWINNQFSSQWQKLFDGTPTLWQDYCSLVPGSTRTVFHGWMNSLPGMKEWNGTSTIENVTASNYSLTRKIYQEIVGLSVDDIEEDQFGLFSGVVDGLGVDAAEWPDSVMSAVVAAGTTALCWDGQYFFDTDHPVDPYDSTKGTFSNNLASAVYDFSKDPEGAFAKGKAAMGAFKKTSGQPAGCRVTHVMFGPSMEQAVLRAVQATVVPWIQKNAAGSENVGAAGISAVYAGTAKPIMNPRITTDDVILMDLSKAVKPFVWQLHKAAQFSSLTGTNTESVFKERQALYKVDGKGVGGYTFPQLAVRCAAS